MVRRVRNAVALPVMLLFACARAPEAVVQDCPPAPAEAPTSVASTPAALAPPIAGATTWREPSAAVRELVDARPTPGVSIDPTGARVLVMQQRAMPGIAEVARPFAALAGLRIDELRAGVRRVRTLDGLTTIAIDTGEASTIVAPQSAVIASPAWSPDGTRVAWLSLGEADVTLWTARADGRDARAVAAVLDLLGPAYRFAKDDLLVVVPHAPAPAPPRTVVPSGPVVEDARGDRAQNRTYQDLLANAHDEARFEAFATGQVAWADVEGGPVRPVGAPGMFTQMDASPDGRFILVERVRRPFSYVVPYERFGRVVEVWDRDGNVVKTIADQEPAEAIPIDGVRTGPRQVEWLATEPATLVWFEAQDGGDPRKAAEHRDAWMRSDAPFSTTIEILRLQHRARDVAALDGDGRVLVREYDRDRRWSTTWLTSASAGAPATKLFDRSSLDAYADPGSPVTRTLASGHRAVATTDGAIFLRGEGATPEGDRPFLDRLALVDGAKARLVESSADSHVEFIGFAGAPGVDALVVRRQGPEVPPDLHVRTATGERALTHWPDPRPGLRGVTRKLLKYRRDDGVELSGTLYLPPGDPPAGGWPLLVWAYPVEYNDKDTAGQVRAATNLYMRVSASSALAMLAAGYAVLDDAAMPVVGDPQTMNDTLLVQLEGAAAAAIDAAAATGLVDRTRTAVGGHSYGAFMTANLLAHTDLFRAGIARSGAYNRTLTPFGYQSERRTLWEAPETYAKVSPLLHADRIDEPLLLVHGEQDDNSGTFPLQSQRLFAAIRGTGGVARLVLLPNEAHSYTARESLLHLLAEEIDWLDTHVRKPAG